MLRLDARHAVLIARGAGALDLGTWKVVALRKVQALKRSPHRLRSRTHKRIIQDVQSATSIDNPIGTALQAFGDDDENLVDVLRTTYESSHSSDRSSPPRAERE